MRFVRSRSAAERVRGWTWRVGVEREAGSDIVRYDAIRCGWTWELGVGRWASEVGVER